MVDNVKTKQQQQQQQQHEGELFRVFEIILPTIVRRSQVSPDFTERGEQYRVLLPCSVAYPERTARRL